MIEGSLRRKKKRRILFNLTTIKFNRKLRTKFIKWLVKKERRFKRNKSSRKRKIISRDLILIDHIEY